MKNLMIIMIVVSLLACQSGEMAEYPSDLEGKKNLLDQKKAEMVELKKVIDQLNDEIAELDPSFQEVARLVRTSVLSSATFERFIKLQGTVVADDRVNVVSEVAGRILMLNVEEGDYVRKGQLIAKLDLESINKQIQEINTALELAKDVYARQSRLWEQNIGSEIQYLEAKNNKERLEKSLETLAFQISKADIYAPISGVVDVEYIQQGEIASPGMPIVQILNVAKLKVEADLPEQYLTIARQGQDVHVTFPTLDMERAGRIRQMGRTIDPANRTLNLEVVLIGSTRQLKPNLLAEIRLREMSLDDVIIIPVEFVLQEVDGKEFVYIVRQEDGKSRAYKTYVKTGPAYEGNIVITEGLEEGVELITTGTRTVSNGELIQIVNSPMASNG